jgi:hypothetical protein
MASRRDRPLTGFTLSPECIAAIEELSLGRGMTKSALIEFLVREESMRMRLDLRSLGARERKKREMPKLRKPGEAARREPACAQ